MKPTFAALALTLVACAAPDAAEPASPTGADDPAGVVIELYDLVTFEAGTTPDWDAVRDLFLEEAVVVLRTGRERMSVFTLEGFVDDFVQFIEQADVEETGFTERILDLRTRTYGDFAHVLVRFDSHVPGSGRPPGEGLDSFELIRRDGRWRIVSIVNERPRPGEPFPPALFE